VVEAMKMETPLRAPVAATVVAVPSAVGAPVAAGQVVVELDPAISGPHQQGNR
jgi:biotin carboxyl carrier protein